MYSIAENLILDPVLLRINALVPYYSMFPLDFPLTYLAGARSGQWVIDPFCGRGTTNYAARLLGLPTVAVDCNPVAVAITRAKMVNVTPEMVVQECQEILASEHHPKEVPEGPFWELCYQPETLRQICVVREALLDDPTAPVRAALAGIMLGILHGPLNRGAPSYLSNQMPRTYATKPGSAVRYWVKTGLKPPRVDVLDVVARRARYSFARLPGPVDCAVILGDSRRLDRFGLSQRFDWVITSPPYPGMRSYYPDQWLRNWFLGGRPDVEYETSAQIGRYSGPEFVSSLACVWRQVAALCRSGARLVVRFGALPSVGRDPLGVLAESFWETGWVVKDVRSAGIAPAGRRQASQFNGKVRHPVEEIDVIAVLE
ncbi:MAG: DNA modification methylase [Firmicutes bacterium]|nr:DNA modification methylase [Bacillota bacterium]